MLTFQTGKQYVVKLAASDCYYHIAHLKMFVFFCHNW